MAISPIGQPVSSETRLNIDRQAQENAPPEQTTGQEDDRNQVKERLGLARDQQINRVAADVIRSENLNNNDRSETTADSDIDERIGTQIDIRA